MKKSLRQDVQAAGEDGKLQSEAGALALPVTSLTEFWRSMEEWVWKIMGPDMKLRVKIFTFLLVQTTLLTVKMRTYLSF